MTAKRKPNGWAKRWADARAQGPEAVQALSAEIRFAMASSEAKRQEAARSLVAELGNCECGAPLMSRLRRRCPPCAARSRRKP